MFEIGAIDLLKTTVCFVFVHPKNISEAVVDPKYHQSNMINLVRAEISTLICVNNGTFLQQLACLVNWAEIYDGFVRGYDRGID